MNPLYARASETASRLLADYGMLCTLVHETVVDDPDSSWKSTVTKDTYPNVKGIVFDDDGVLFVNHNITGNVRILMIEPIPTLANVSVGDKVTLANGEVVQVKKYKHIDPDLSGTILWALLIV
jgi:hypothetical protein